MTSPTDNPQSWEQYNDLSVGEVLRRARMQYGLSLDDVARTLRIRAAQLGALEDNRPDLLPGRVYAIGFVRAYAEYLALDGDKIVHLFKAQSVGGRTRPELSLPAPASESKAPGALVLVSSLVALAILFGALAFIGAHHKRTPEAIPPVPGTLAADFAVLAVPPLAAAIQNAALVINVVPPPGVAAPVITTRIVLQARDSVWLEIHDAAGKPVLSRILKPGDSYDVPDQPGLKLDTGNAGALLITVDGQPVAPLGQVGDVKRGMLLDPATLKTGVAPKTPDASKTGHKNHVKKQSSPDEAAPLTIQTDHYNPDHFTPPPARTPYYNQ